MTARDELPPLSDMDVAARVDQTREVLGDVGCEALLITKAANVRWLTGFTGSNGQVLITTDELVVITDGRYREQIRLELERSGVEASIEITAIGVREVLAGRLSSGLRLGLEAHDLTWKRRDDLAAGLPGIVLVAVDELIEDLRKVKDQGELSRLVRSATIADQALAEVAPRLDERPTERMVARALDWAMLDLGADEPSYDTIVASGPNAALPHARPTDRTIESGDLVIIDVGARLEGYGSDMTRTFVAGGELSSEQRHWYDAVIAAQAAGVAAVSDGVDERQIDDECRHVLAEYDLLDAFIHGTGHGIGLEIHENPILSPRSEGILRAGLVVTVEPGVYVAGKGGVRIEDSVVVGLDGCEPITHSPKTPAP